MASNLLAMTPNLLAMAPNLLAMAPNLLAMASNLVAMASNLLGMASTLVLPLFCDVATVCRPRSSVRGFAWCFAQGGAIKDFCIQTAVLSLRCDFQKSLMGSLVWSLVIWQGSFVWKGFMQKYR